MDLGYGVIHVSIGVNTHYHLMDANNHPLSNPIFVKYESYPPDAPVLPSRE